MSAAGGGGNDTLNGGTGSDLLTGGTGDDVLRGQDGNDDLAGDSGSNTLDGGTGTNWCTVGAADIQNACVYALSPATVVWSEVTPATVDVTDADRPVKVRMRIVDDTGVFTVAPAVRYGDTDVQVGRMRLVSGTVRDGTWEADGMVARYSPPTAYALLAWVHDRLARETYLRQEAALTVVDEHPDTTPPVVASVVLDRDAVDVRTEDATVNATVRITDDLAGVGETWDDVQLVMMPLIEGVLSPGGASTALMLDAGSRQDGYWRGTVRIPRDTIGGTWSMYLWTRDRVTNAVYYAAQPVKQFWDADPNRPHARLLVGAPVLTVTGSSDVVPASLLALRVDRTPWTRSRATRRSMSACTPRTRPGRACWTWACSSSRRAPPRAPHSSRRRSVNWSAAPRPTVGGTSPCWSRRAHHRAAT